MHTLWFQIYFPLPHNSMILTSSGTEIVFTMNKKKCMHLQFQYNEPDAEEQAVNSLSSFSSKLCSSKCKQFDIRARG